MGIKEWQVVDSRCKRAQVLGAVVLRKDKHTLLARARIVRECGVWVFQAHVEVVVATSQICVKHIKVAGLCTSKRWVSCVCPGEWKGLG